MSEVTRDCLDAETLAAWMDDGLSPAALAAARTHVAGCARCQALVATMVRLEPAPAAAPARARWWLPWLAPVATVAAAVTLWFAVLRTDPAVPSLQEASKQATLSAPSATAPPPAAAEPAAKTLADQALSDTSAFAKERRAAAETKNEASGRARADKDLKKADAAPSRPAAAAAPPAQAANAEARQEAQARLSAPTLDALGRIVEIRSPDAAVRWRLANGRVEKTIDSGATWIAQQVPATAPLVHGVSPARNVCWLVGGNGLVLLTTDGGQIWRRLAFPELTALASIAAADAVSATVRTADGREFVTKDAGITWNLKGLQEF